MREYSPAFQISADGIPNGAAGTPIAALPPDSRPAGSGRTRLSDPECVYSGIIRTALKAAL